MFAPGYAEPILTLFGAGLFIAAWAGLEIRERRRQNAELEADEHPAEAARTPAE